jgi:hypothetical protein
MLVPVSIGIAYWWLNTNRPGKLSRVTNRPGKLSRVTNRPGKLSRVTNRLVLSILSVSKRITSWQYLFWELKIFMWLILDSHPKEYSLYRMFQIQDLLQLSILGK